MYGSPRTSRGVLSWPRACVGCGSSNIVEMEKWSFHSQQQERRNVGYNMVQTTTSTLKAEGQLQFCPQCIDYLSKSRKFNLKVQGVKFFISLMTALLIGATSLFLGNWTFLVFSYIIGGVVWSMYFLWQMINPYSGKKQDRFMTAEAAHGHKTILFKFRSPTFGGLFNSVNPGTMKTIDESIGKTEKSMSDNWISILIIIIIAGVIGGISAGLGALYNLILSGIVIAILPDLKPKPGEVPIYTGHSRGADSSSPFEFKTGESRPESEDTYKPPDRKDPDDDFEWG